MIPPTSFSSSSALMKMTQSLEEGGGGRQDHLPVLDETSLPHSLYIYIALRERGSKKEVDEDYNNILLCKKRTVTQSPPIFGRAEQSDQHLVVVTKKFFCPNSFERNRDCH